MTLYEQPPAKPPVVPLRTIAVALVVIALALSALAGITIYRQVAPSAQVVEPGPVLTSALAGLIAWQCMQAVQLGLDTPPFGGCGSVGHNWTKPNPG